MAKYSSRSSGPIEPSRMNREIHPIWRGVGFVMMVLSPLLGFAVMTLFMDENAKQGWVIFPSEIIVNGPDPLIWVRVILVVLSTLIIFGLVTFISFIIFRLFAPPEYGPYDVPPVTYKGKQYKR